MAKLKIPKKARCASCGKKREVEMSYPEIEDASLDGELVTIAVSIPLNCAECGDTVGNLSYSIEEMIPLDKDDRVTITLDNEDA